MDIMTKGEARNHFLNLRQSLSAETIAEMDKKLLVQFQKLNLEGISQLHLFLPILSKKEINTYLIAEWLRGQYPEIQLVLSRSNFDNHSLSHFIWEKDTPLVENRWGITEPQGGKESKAHTLDLVLVPLLACDKRGHRVGYGKGFYDRFLAECRPDVRKVGLSFFEPLDIISDTNPQDIPLDTLITPEKIWKFD